jgi:acyl-CoA thioester hydrolase
VTEEPKNDEPRKLIHVARIALRWRDMDIHRHVNNTVYFRYLEQARIEWFDTVRSEWSEADEGCVIASAHCNYLKPLTYPAAIEVCLYADSPGRSSFTFYYDVFRAGDRSVRYAEGYTRLVWVDRRTERSVPLPDFMRAALA